jgi:N,N'-diacetylchitobiose transport system substrate-binding protein
MGNTEMTKYMAAGAFANITKYKGSFSNSAHWLAGLAKSSTYNGKLEGVPYYAGSRLVAYRTDLFKGAGIKTLPKSLATFETDLSKVGKKYKGISGFKPFYMAGTDWYSALSFLFDYGGNIASLSKGKWVGQLESANSIAGLTAYKKFFNAYSPHSAATLDEAHPAPYTVFSQNNTSAIFGPGWFSCCTGATYKNVTAQFVMPSHVAGKSMPGFQAKGNIPNATNLLDNSVNDKAAKSSWFVPTAKHWVDVENANTLRTLLSKILTGTSVKSAAHSADASLKSILNQP